MQNSLSLSTNVV